MKSKFTLISFLVTLSIILGSSLNVPTHSNGAGAPISSGKGYTGSTFDARTCNTAGGCHSGPAVSTETASISSTVPTAGYTPGSTYTVSATLNATATKAGFQATCMDATGNLKGTLIATNTTTTQLVGSSKYITHKSGGTVMSGGTKTWSFDWTAPASGTGSVTMNATFNATNSNSGSDGDVIVTASLNIAEAAATSVYENEIRNNGVRIFPNPVRETFNVGYFLESSELVVMELTDISGKSIAQWNLGNKNQGFQQETITPENPLAQGLYILTISTGQNKFIEKLIVQ